MNWSSSHFCENLRIKFIKIKKPKNCQKISVNFSFKILENFEIQGAPKNFCWEFFIQSKPNFCAEFLSPNFHEKWPKKFVWDFFNKKKSFFSIFCSELILEDLKKNFYEEEFWRKFSEFGRSTKKTTETLVSNQIFHQRYHKEFWINWKKKILCGLT